MSCNQNCNVCEPPKPNCPAVPIPPFGGDVCNCCAYTTKYYNLPLWKANDVTSWLVGMNTAMECIDKILHQFALRTGIDGEPSDLILAVQENTGNVKQLLEWQKCAMSDLANTTKVLANQISNQEVINEKIRVLNFNYNNLDVRMKSLEQTVNDVVSENGKLLENMDSIAGQIDDILQQNDEFRATISELHVTNNMLLERIEAIEEKIGVDTPPNGVEGDVNE